MPRSPLRYARKLGETGKHDVTSQLLVFEVALRRGKLLQALRALRRAAAAAPEFSPDVFSAKVRFLVSAQGEAGTAATEAVQAVLAEELPAADLLPSGTVPQLVGAFAEAHKLSLPHRTAAAEMMVRRWPVACMWSVRVHVSPALPRRCVCGCRCSSTLARRLAQWSCSATPPAAACRCRHA